MNNFNKNHVKLKSYTNEELERLIQLKSQSLEHLQALNSYSTPMIANIPNMNYSKGNSSSSTNNINICNPNINSIGYINPSQNNVSFGLTPHGLTSHALNNQRDLNLPEKVEANFEFLMNSNVLNNINFNDSFQNNGSRVDNVHYIHNINSDNGGNKGNSSLTSDFQPKLQQYPNLQNLVNKNDFQLNKADTLGINNTYTIHSISINDSKLDIPQIRNSIETSITNRFSNKENFNLSMTSNFANNASNMMPPPPSGSKVRGGDSSGN